MDSDESIDTGDCVYRIDMNEVRFELGGLQCRQLYLLALRISVKITP